MEYWLKGETYSIKEELKALGCSWCPNKKMWKTLWLDKDEVAFKRLDGLTLAHDVEMIPVKLSPECQKIQDILNSKE